MISDSWHNIPLELRKRKQWAIAGDDKIPRGIDGKPIKVNDPTQWLEFNEAAKVADKLGCHVGYILSDEDPYSVIDLDVKDATNCADPKKWTTQNQYNLYWTILREFDTYSEYSKSTKGFHIWVRGKCRSGRRDGVEVYSNLRFIITTGMVINNKSITNWQDKLTQFANELHSHEKNTDHDLVEIEEIEDDIVVIEKAMAAENSAKFNALCAGEWQIYGYPSQSEADLALMAIIAFYTKSNEQCRRIFRMSNLGKRDKAIKNNVYLDRTLKQVRARQSEQVSIPSLDFSGLIDAANLNKTSSTQTTASPFSQSAPLSNSVAMSAPVPDIVSKAPTTGLEWPPGFAGVIAKFMYGAAPRPVKEVAIVSTLGFLAGVCGKAFSIPLSGLNLYIILIARSAIGKEAMHSSISALASAVSDSCPYINNFLSFTDFVSGPALLKEVIGNPSICNVSGEWGQKLMHIAKGEREAGPLATLRKEMTNLYQKSGSKSIVGGLAYSDTDKNIASVTGVAYSMIGETTPETFYSAVTPSMMADGFMSRFLTVEYNGDRPPLNKNQTTVPDKALVDSVAAITERAHTVIAQGESIPVTKRESAEELLDAFELKCDERINATDDEAQRQMWNRASLKALRVAGLLAVADNWQIPVMRVEHVKWAITLVEHGIALMETRIDAGEVGMDDATREKRLLTLIDDYFNNKPGTSYKIPDKLYNDGIIPRSWLTIKIQKNNAFSSHRMGSTKALDYTIEHLINNGILVEIDKVSLITHYDGYRGKCYRML